MLLCPLTLVVVAKLSLQTAAVAAPQKPADPAVTAVTSEIDQTIIALGTTMPLKRHHSYFRLTHRFAGDLRRGDFGDLASTLFTLDDGAIIGLEYRFGVTSTLQAGIHRSILGKTIEAFGRWDLWREIDGRPLSISATPSIEGQNNLRQDPQPGLALTFSRTFGKRLAAYALPSYVHNAHTETLRLIHEGHVHQAGEDDADHSAAVDTLFVGLGGRVRISESVSAAAELSPRVAGYKPGPADWNAGIEKITHGHVLQLNFGNNFNTTPGMIARGGNPDEVFMGFNISRKF
jgi:hypothetical protein